MSRTDIVRRDDSGRWFFDRPGQPALELRYDRPIEALEQMEAIAQRQAELVVARLGGERWLDKPGLAEHYSCSVRTVENWMAEGLPNVTIAGKAKFRVSEATAWLEAHDLIELTAKRNGGRMAVTSSTNGGGTASTARPRPPGG